VPPLESAINYRFFVGPSHGTKRSFACQAKKQQQARNAFFSMTYDFIEEMKLESNNRLQEYANVCAGEKEVNKLVL
jgi:hypothetical protein